MLVAGLSAVFPDAALSEPLGSRSLSRMDATVSSSWGEFVGEDRCTECHELYPRLSHPVGVIPSMPIPVGFPLQDGRLTCITCHDANHFRTASTGGASAAISLRGASRTARGFCAECHSSAGGGGRRTAMHASATGRAHLVWRASRGRSRGSRSLSLQYTKIADVGLGHTQKCLSCHDGVLAPNARYARSTGPFLSGGDHPVDVPFLSHNRRIRRNLTPITTLDPRIRLPNGRVSCETCHSPYSRLEYQLVMAGPQTRLCMSCHEI